MQSLEIVIFKTILHRQSFSCIKLASPGCFAIINVHDLCRLSRSYNLHILTLYSRLFLGESPCIDNGSETKVETKRGAIGTIIWKPRTYLADICRDFKNKSLDLLSNWGYYGEQRFVYTYASLTAICVDCRACMQWLHRSSHEHLEPSFRRLFAMRHHFHHCQPLLLSRQSYVNHIFAVSSFLLNYFIKWTLLRWHFYSLKVNLYSN